MIFSKQKFDQGMYYIGYYINAENYFNYGKNLHIHYCLSLKIKQNLAEQ